MERSSAAEPRFTFAEVFAGIGGFRVALEALGGRCVFASEYSVSATATLRANFEPCVACGDVRKIVPAMVPQHDILVGGFPCQSFSNAGARGGLEDERGALFYELCRLTAACKPRAMLLENVRGLLTNPGAFAEVCGCLRAAGYAVRCSLLDSATLLPQRRRRLFLVAFRLDLQAIPVSLNTTTNTVYDAAATEAIAATTEQPISASPTTTADAGAICVAATAEAISVAATTEQAISAFPTTTTTDEGAICVAAVMDATSVATTTEANFVDATTGQTVGGHALPPWERFEWPLLPELRRAATSVLHGPEEMTAAQAEALSIGEATKQPFVYIAKRSP